eukprot:scaffold3401_cov80-Skeletonema_menzelii.AAC.1
MKLKRSDRKRGLSGHEKSENYANNTEQLVATSSSSLFGEDLDTTQDQDASNSEPEHPVAVAVLLPSLFGASTTTQEDQDQDADIVEQPEPTTAILSKASKRGKAAKRAKAAKGAKATKAAKGTKGTKATSSELSSEPSSQPSVQPSAQPSESSQPSSEPSSQPFAPTSSVPCDGMEVWTLDIDWFQAPYDGIISEENGGLKLYGSDYRVGNKVISKAWYNLEEASIYFKWRTSGTHEEANWAPGIVGVISAFGGAVQIYGNTDYYTKISCDVDAGKCVSWTSTGDYIDRDGSTSVTTDERQLTSLQKDILKRAQLFFEFGDNYAGTNEYGILLEVITDGAIVNKPTTAVPIYSGENAIPQEFAFASDGNSTCDWGVIEHEGVNVISGSVVWNWNIDEIPTSECALGYGFSTTLYPLTKGVSFSMKTEVYAQVREDLAGLGIHDVLWSNSASGWKSYCVPIPTPSLQSIKWSLSPRMTHAVGYGRFVGSERMYLKDIKLLVDDDE